MALLKSMGADRVVVFDVQEEYSGRGWTRCYDLDAVRDAMVANWSGKFKISFVPPDGETVEAFHWFCKLIWQAQEPYHQGRDDRKILIIIEEADTAIPNQKLPRKYSAAIGMINRGRHRGIDAIAITQRPALIMATYRSNVSSSYVLPLAFQNDKNVILEMIGRQFHRELSEMPNFSFLKIVDGQVTRHKLLKSGAITGRTK